jgi:Glycosyl transferase family 2
MSGANSRERIHSPAETASSSGFEEIDQTHLLLGFIPSTAPKPLSPPELSAAISKVKGCPRDSITISSSRDSWGVCVNRPLQHSLVGNWATEIELHDRASDPQYQSWVRTARLYEATFAARCSVSPETQSSCGNSTRVLTIRFDRSYHLEVTETLKAAYCDLAAGDILVLDIPRGIERDLLSRLLFAAGFDRPLVWAGRKILEAENGTSKVTPLLPSSALGAGPALVPGHDIALNVGPEQIVVVARRGALAPPGERPWRLSVILPVYNEKNTFRELIELLLAKTIPGFEIEVCLIESNSTDGTREDVLAYADHPRVQLLLEDKPLGKGHAVRKGLKVATGDIILIQDADLEYDLADYEKLLDPLRRLETSFVLGSRHSADRNDWQIRHFSEQRGIASIMNAGHVFFTWFLNMLFSQRLRDPFTMYKVFRRDCINNIPFECNRFDFDIELFGKLIRRGYKPIEIGVRYNSRSFDEGKKVSMFGDPPTWIRAGIRHRFSNLHTWPQTG